ncbi:MAG TPA: RNase adapter RapZ [Clostridiaceae bacterium]|nr:RNase adapter RapZ [Clostridiaceae bacterium]
MDIIILTGMSGAGKSKAANFLEDMGYFCIDNLPPQLLGNIVYAFKEGQGGEGFGIDRLAFVIDVRSAEFLAGAQAELKKLDADGIKYRIIFLDASDEVLIRRYKQSRRNHPLAREKGLSQSLSIERRQLSFLRFKATYIIDTTDLSIPNLRDHLYKLLQTNDGVDERMSLLLVSFGFKYGLPLECDEIIDVRFLTNPFYVPELKPLCGLDKEVREYVLAYEEAQVFLQKHEELFRYTLPYYIKEGKVRLTMGVGCTGGRHRSVVMAEELARRFRQNDIRVLVSHRDISKDPQNETKGLNNLFD